MNFELNQGQSAKKWVGIVAVLAFHLMLGYALVSGLATEVVDVVRKPVLVSIVEPPKPPAPAVHKETKVAPPHLVKHVASVRAPTVHKAVRKAVPAPVVPVPTPEPVAPTPPVTNAPAPSMTVAPAAPAVTPGPPAAPVHTSASADLGACAKPRYPESSLDNEEEGTVTLAFLIGADGSVLKSRVDKSSGWPALDRAARDALSLCKFKPATSDGKPVQSWTRMAYVWKLE